MLRIIVDSGSSIKQSEKELYGVDILPIHVRIGGKEYKDGVDLDIDAFYEELMKKEEFPQTALPSLEDTQALVEGYTGRGDEVLIITISSEISGTYQAIRMLFSENEKVLVYDSRMAVGGIRFLAEEARKYEELPLEEIAKKLDELLPRIVIAALPETLDYLLAGGRLSKTAWMVGSLLSIKPVIGFSDGQVSVLAKKRGLAQGKKYLAELAESCDPEYGIIASYTYNKENIDEVIAITPEPQQKLVKVYDNLSPSIACHWGPNAFGYIFVAKK